MWRERGYRSLGVLLAIMRRCHFRQGFEGHAEGLNRAEAARIRNLTECAVGFLLQQESFCLADALI